MPYKIITVVFTFFVATLCFSQQRHEANHQYEGDFYFPDGSYITGGPMDEVEGSLLFMDPLRLDKGGLFLQTSDGSFRSLFDSTTSILFDYGKTGEVPGLWWRTANNKPLYAHKKTAFSVIPVRFYSGPDTLSGELYLPFTKGPHPVIIQVHGSGKQKRHAGPWNTFFLQHGVAVLTYDKRGVGQSSGEYSTAGYHDLAADVLAAISYLKGRPDINPAKIGLHGSSEGGWVSAIAASMSDALSFMIIRAGSGVSGSDTYMHEVKIELLEKSLAPGDYVQAVHFERAIQDLAASGKTLEEVNAFIRQSREKNSWFAKAFGNYKAMNPNYWVKLQKIGPVDPAKYLRQVADIPVLWFLAENDENVPYGISKIRIQDALVEAGNNKAELVTLAGANHAFLIRTPEGRLQFTDGYWNKMLSWLKMHAVIQP